MGTRRIKVKRWKVDAAGKMQESSAVVAWSAMINEDHPLLGGPVANNA